MAFIWEETSFSRFWMFEGDLLLEGYKLRQQPTWMLEGALLFNCTVLHPPTQVGHEVSLDLDAFNV